MIYLCTIVSVLGITIFENLAGHDKKIQQKQVSSQTFSRSNKKAYLYFKNCQFVQ